MSCFESIGVRQLVLGAILSAALGGCGAGSPASLAQAARPSAAAAGPGAALRPRAQLLYESEGARGAPWVVDSLDLAASYGGRNGCAYVRFGSSDIRRVCVAGDTLYAWNEASARLEPTRAVGERMSLRIPRRTGGWTIYETGTAEEDIVGTVRLRVIPTTILTHDTTGRVVRRLRERYALAIVTATWGIFETPPAGADSVWKKEREFRLVEICCGEGN